MTGTSRDVASLGLYVGFDPARIRPAPAPGPLQVAPKAF